MVRDSREHSNQSKGPGSTQKVKKIQKIPKKFFVDFFSLNRLAAMSTKQLELRLVKTPTRRDLQLKKPTSARPKPKNMAEFFKFKAQYGGGPQLKKSQFYENKAKLEVSDSKRGYFSQNASKAGSQNSDSLNTIQRGTPQTKIIRLPSSPAKEQEQKSSRRNLRPPDVDDD